jgi:hypothetical protein
MFSSRYDGDEDPVGRSRRRGSALVRFALAGSVVAGLIITIPAVVGPGAAAGPSTLVSGAAGQAGLQQMAASMPVGQDPSFPISGSVQGLAPGVRSQLAVAISNPFEFPIRIIQLTVVVGDAPRPCVGKDLEIEPFRGPVQVPARSRATTYLGVTLSDSSPDVCQAATWPLTYRGQAVMLNASGGGRASTPVAKPGAPSPESSGSGLPLTGLTLWVLITVAVVPLVAGAGILLVQRCRAAAARRTYESRAP